MQQFIYRTALCPAIESRAGDSAGSAWTGTEKLVSQTPHCVRSNNSGHQIQCDDHRIGIAGFLPCLRIADQRGLVGGKQHAVLGTVCGIALCHRERRQRLTAVKGIVADGGAGCRQCDVRQLLAVLKGILPDGGQPIRQLQRCQRRAAVKRLVSNALQSVRQFQNRQECTFIEQSIRQRRQPSSFLSSIRENTMS